MHPSPRRSLLVVLCAVLTVSAGCGSDDPESSPDSSLGSDGSTSSSETTASTVPADPYCARVATYEAATNIDVTTVDSTLDGFSAGAAAARAIVAVAPPEVREAHHRLATGAEALVTRLSEAAPETVDALTAAAAEISAQLETEMGDLTAETAAVQAFAQERCGLPAG